MQSIDRAAEAGDIQTVAHFIRVTEKLDHYHSLVHLAAAREPAPGAPSLAQSRKRTENDS